LENDVISINAVRYSGKYAEMEKHFPNGLKAWCWLEPQPPYYKDGKLNTLAPAELFYCGSGFNLASGLSIKELRVFGSDFHYHMVRTGYDVFNLVVFNITENNKDNKYLSCQIVKENRILDKRFNSSKNLTIESVYHKNQLLTFFAEVENG